ncbi:MAG: PEP-CTERM sorting domain-containing protein [Planctomycetota bacterium]|nr:MAG: PEP-CTERM sorting domain-containing protein [Planctomycetota bacterium]
MQRSLALVFSLILVSATSAATVYDLKADETSVYVNVVGPPEDLYVVMTIESPGVFTAAYLAPGSPEYSWWELQDPPTSVMGMFQGGLYQAGTWAMADYSAASPVTVSFYTVDESMEFFLKDAIVVPEPTTIALLGLGALLLRKHRRIKSYNR